MYTCVLLHGQHIDTIKLTPALSKPILHPRNIDIHIPYPWNPQRPQKSPMTAWSNTAMPYSRTHISIFLVQGHWTVSQWLAKWLSKCLTTSLLCQAVWGLMLQVRSLTMTGGDWKMEPCNFKLQTSRLHYEMEKLSPASWDLNLNVWFVCSWIHIP